MENIFFTLTQYKMKNYPQFTDFVTLVNEKIELEEYTATTNKTTFFYQKMVLLFSIINCWRLAVQIQILLLSISKKLKVSMTEFLLSTC